MDINKLKKIIIDCNSKADILRNFDLVINGRNHKKMDKIIKEYGIDISHFDGGRSKRRKYSRIKKECPVCNTLFEIIDNANAKITCSHSCSNTYFRSGKNHGNWKDITEYYHDLRNPILSKKYRKICFDNHKHECVVCGEDKILDVHHYDGDRKNNNPNNLIPICPTHHNYIHSDYKELVINKVNEYIKNYVNS
jgi:hypothetical protein